MKTISIKLLLVILIFNFSSCKNESASFTDYKFADQTQVITCTNVDSKILNEALYSFEKDIIPFYDKQKQNANRAYNMFTKQATNRKIDVTKFASKHSVELANALKSSGFIGENGVNYNNPLIKCIAENMQKGDIKTTFKALVSVNSMSKSLFNPALQTKTHRVHADKYLSMYVALEYFYAEILKTDFTKVDFNRPDVIINEELKKQVQEKNSKVDFNKRPRKQ